MRDRKSRQIVAGLSMRERRCRQIVGGVIAGAALVVGCSGESAEEDAPAEEAQVAPSPNERDGPATRHFTEDGGIAPGVSELMDRQQGDDDVLPASATGDETRTIDSDSARRAGEARGIEYYVAYGVEENRLCLVEVEEEPLTSTCSVAEGFGGIWSSHGDRQALLLADGADLDAVEGDGWTLVTEFLAVK